MKHVLAEVRIYDGESIDSALRRFKRQVQQEGIIKEVKRTVRPNFFVSGLRLWELSHLRTSLRVTKIAQIQEMLLN